MKIGFIGLGNMATAIIGGLLREDTALSSEDGNATVITAANIIGSAKTEATRQKRAEQFGIAVTASNREVAEAADVLVLAVKPQFFPEVIAEIRDAVSENTLVISIAAGLTLERIAGLFDRNVTAMRLIRCMPNTPALVNAGCTAVVPGPGATEADEALCLRLMESFGRAIVIPERLMDAASATAGSSPPSSSCSSRPWPMAPWPPGCPARKRTNSPRRPSPDRPNSCWKPGVIRAT